MSREAVSAKLAWLAVHLLKFTDPKQPLACASSWPDSEIADRQVFPTLSDRSRPLL